jgi:ankyrin repeat protein
MKCTVPTCLQTTGGVSPLHLAVFNGEREILRLLLRSTPRHEVSPRGQGGLTPLMVATGHADREMMRDLFCAGASFSEGDDSGKDSIAMARESSTLGVVYALGAGPRSRPVFIPGTNTRKTRKTRRKSQP